MTDTAGKLRLEDPSTGYTFDFGTVTDISETFQKSCSVTPIVTKPKQSAFPIESRTYKQITVSFTRKQPENINNSARDTLRWSNSHWTTMLMQSLDRWQARTNGYRLSYVPAGDNPFIAPIKGAGNASSETGYVKNLSLRGVKGRLESIQGSFEFHVGSMYVQSPAPDNILGYAREGFSISLSDENGTNNRILLSMGNGKDINLVESCTVTGGPEAPFEYAQITIPRKAFSAAYPGLLSAGVSKLKAGRNKVTVSLAGTSTMTLTKVKLSGNYMTLTAYCNAERLKGEVLPNKETHTPESWIDFILTTGKFGVTFKGSSLVKAFTAPVADNSEYVSEDLDVTFPEGTNVWYILQTAAMMCKARVFFAKNKAYVIDYTDYSYMAPKTVDLYPGSGSLYGGAVTGNVDLGDEGTDTLVNTVKIRCSVPALINRRYAKNDDGSIKYTNSEVTFADEASKGLYGTVEGGLYQMTALKYSDGDIQWKGEKDPNAEEGGEGSGEGGTEGGDTGGEGGGETPVEPSVPDGETVRFSQAKRFADNLIAYLSEPQQTVSFTLRELRSGGTIGMWQPYFEPASAVRSISDSVNEIYVSNESEIKDTEPKSQKLALKVYEQSYPECTTKYDWGVLASMDLSSNTSRIVSAQNNQ